MPFLFDRAGMERYNNIGQKEKKCCLNDNTGADFPTVPVGDKVIWEGFALDRIKSAYEMALERFKQRKEVPQAEMDRMEYEPLGKSIAAIFLREKDFDMMVEVAKYPQQFQGYVLEGIQKTFLSNLLPPIDKNTLEANLRAMEGLLLLKKDKGAVKEVLDQLKNLFQYYEQALNQTYSQFKQQFAEKLSPSIRAIENRTGQKFKIDPEKQPGFRDEWNKVVSRLSLQYEQVLDEQKEKLRNIK
ncbi:MAG TPA: hypothetical protein DCZ10_20205 [Pelotomaculum sp.]|nr:hypothetical protein [Pelotomaculum sp.]